MALNPLEPGRFFLPGPTEVTPEVLQAQARPVLGHRGPEMRSLMKGLQEGLKAVFRTARPVLVATSSATGLMEAAIRNGVRERALCLVNGAFSERFARIAEACGRAADRLDVPWGQVHDPATVGDRVAGGGYDAVTLVHSETSTGALNPLAELASAVKEADPDCLVLVDSVTGLGGAPLLTDEWGLDFVLTGSQKALALPPGLAFGVASEALLARAVEIPGRGVYFDLAQYQEEMSGLETPTTPAVTLLYALERQLGRIGQESLEDRWARHRAMAQRVAAWVQEMRVGGVDLRILAPEGARSPTVTCLVLPEDRPGPQVVEGMRRRGWVIGGGYGKLKEGTVRIGHMGDHTPEALESLLAALASELAP